MAPVLMARLAPRSQLPRRLLLENRAWPERLRLLVPAGPRPLPAPGGAGTAPEPLLTSPAVTPACHCHTTPGLVRCRCPESRPTSATFEKKSGIILNPSFPMD